MDAARKYLEETVVGMTSQSPELGAKYQELLALFERRLWHNVTSHLLELVNDPRLKESPQLISLYSDFIKHFETKINPLSLVHIILPISKAYSDPNEVVQFLEHIAKRVSGPEGSHEAHLLVRALIVQLKLQQDPVKNREDAKQMLESIQSGLEGVAGIDTSVYATYYRAQATYHKVGSTVEFYRNTLLYLSYTAMESLTEQEKLQTAFDLGIAALVGEDLYSFGDLLAHPIIDSLVGTQGEWLYHLLHAFNAGDISKYEQLVAQYESQLSSQPILVSHVDRMKEKIAILCLIELIFDHQAQATSSSSSSSSSTSSTTPSTSTSSRSIPLSAIASATKVEQDAVELLVMKALSLHLLRGKIDQLSQTFHVSWVQSRVLGLDHIKKMRDHLQEWTKKVNQTSLYIEQGIPEVVM